MKNLTPYKGILASNVTEQHLQATKYRIILWFSSNLTEHTVGGTWVKPFTLSRLNVSSGAVLSGLLTFHWWRNPPSGGVSWQP